MRRISFRAIAVGLVTVMLIGNISSAVYGKVKNADAIAEKLNYVTDEFRVNDVSLDDDSELVDVMKYARNNKNEYLIVKKESASTSAFKNNVKEIVGEKNMLAGNLLYRGMKKAEKYRNKVEKARSKSGQIVYVDKTQKAIKKMLKDKSTSKKELRQELNGLYEKQQKSMTIWVM